MAEKSAGPKGSGALHGLDQHMGAQCGALSAKDKDAGCYEVSEVLKCWGEAGGHGPFG